MFEIDDAADIANFEKIARTVETLASSNPDSARNGSERKAGFIEVSLDFAITKCLTFVF